MDQANEAEGQQTNKEKVATQAQSSHAAGIADAIVIKDAELFFLSENDGSVPCEGGHGLGLYYHDCRFLSGYRLHLAGTRPESLAASSEDGFRSLFQLTNPTIESDDGVLTRQRIGIRWRHVIDADDRTLRDELVFENYDTGAHRLPVSIAFDADFRDVFAIRGMIDQRPGVLRPLAWDDDELVFGYDGGDGRLRELRIRFSEAPAWKRDQEVGFDLHLESQAAVQLAISLAVVERDRDEGAPPSRSPHVENAPAERAREASMRDWMRGFAEVQSSSVWLDRAIHRSLVDLRALEMSIEGDRFFAAGVPWFSTLFGRDSIVCALQTLAYRPEVAADTLRILARFQGRKDDPQSEEEPGKILHELRIGELARMGKIPYTPYYGTVDATPLFLVLLAQHARWTGDLSLFHELRDAAEAALRWTLRTGDHDGDGWLDYRSKSGARLINQGWKDSGNAILDARGRSAEPPIALVEVQGYAYLARQRMAWLFERDGDAARAAELRRDAEALRDRFDRDFWMEERRFHALALERGGRQVDAIASNPGQALWSGIVAPERVGAMVERLMADDLYSGWGIRTLSSRERAYNPVGYHLGSVWPHDNALIAAGLRANGHEEAACRIFADLLAASTHFDEHRLPELFAGFPRDEYGFPVRYPVACHPQAWAAGSIPFLLTVLLGLDPDGVAGTLRIERPCMPDFLDRLRFQRLRVGRAEADLLFERTPSGEFAVHVDRLDGELAIEVVPRSDRPG